MLQILQISHDFFQATKETATTVSNCFIGGIHEIGIFVNLGAGDDDGADGNSLVAVEKLESHRIMSIGINRPEKRNCVDFATADELVEAFEDFEQDEVTMFILVYKIL